MDVALSNCLDGCCIECCLRGCCIEYFLDGCCIELSRLAFVCEVNKKMLLVTFFRRISKISGVFIRCSYSVHSCALRWGRAHMNVHASVGQGVCKCACFGGARRMNVHACVGEGAYEGACFGGTGHM